MTRYLMRVDIFEVDVLEVNVSALPQIGSLAIKVNFTTKMEYLIHCISILEKHGHFS